jgi:hypothetical protein
LPFELGRPFGPPSDPAFQKRVILAALRLLERDRGPIVIEDFPDDDPRAQPDPGWHSPQVPGIKLTTATTDIAVYRELGSHRETQLPNGGGR